MILSPVGGCVAGGYLSDNNKNKGVFYEYFAYVGNDKNRSVWAYLELAVANARTSPRRQKRCYFKGYSAIL